MPKLTEKQLYGTWLDIYYADQLNDQFVLDLQIEMKGFKQCRAKTKKMLKKAAEQYKKIYGHEPIIFKKVR